MCVTHCHTLPSQWVQQFLCCVCWQWRPTYTCPSLARSKSVGLWPRVEILKVCLGILDEFNEVVYNNKSNPHMLTHRVDQSCNFPWRYFPLSWKTILPVLRMLLTQLHCVHKKPATRHLIESLILLHRWAFTDSSGHLSRLIFLKFTGWQVRLWQNFVDLYLNVPMSSQTTLVTLYYVVTLVK